MTKTATEIVWRSSEKVAVFVVVFVTELAARTIEGAQRAPYHMLDRCG